MTKIQEIGTVAPGIVATKVERLTDYLVGARDTGVSPTAYEDLLIPASVLDRGTIYDFGMSFNGNPTTSFYHRVVIGADIIIPADFARSHGWVTTPPSSGVSLLLRVEGLGSPGDLVTIATISISTGGVFTFTPAASPAADIAIEEGSRVWFAYDGTGSPSVFDGALSDIDIIIGARIA